MDEPAEQGRRVAAILEYDGTEFAGWQSQEHARCIQDVVEEALSFVAGHALTATCAGRTDRGVHAAAQVIHFDPKVSRTPRAWVLGANTRLPPSIALQWAGEPAPGFHARHRAIRRVYRYCILNRSERSALAYRRAAWIVKPLEAPLLHAAAQCLVGEHDFSSFRSAECQSPTPVRRVERIEVRREGDYLWLEIAANAFLHHMVRNIVGTLLKVQSGPDPSASLAQVLAGRDRRLGGATAPPEGLYLWRVEYPAASGVPELSAGGLPLPPGAGPRQLS
ncbi:MAG TPA: tRNA pseudouridine(38-40) synthase TruA [Steroidobacteraceae bacterium]|nr:tRNA pseudouridine(38-40) synthase TruA [Steroidobacteraceae bacterium]